MSSLGSALEEKISLIVSRRRSWSQRPIEEQARIPLEELIKNAVEHRMSNACSVYNAETKRHELRSLRGTSPSDLGHYGVGVQLYFEFLFAFGVFFAFCFALGSPLLIFGSVGSMVWTSSGTANAHAAYKLFGTLSVANLGSCDGCVKREEFHSRTVSSGASLRVDEVTPWLGTLDGLALCALMAFGLWFRFWWIPRSRAKQDEAHITAADYAVHVTRLPRLLGSPFEHTQYEELLRDHFRQILLDAGVAREEAVVEEVAIVREYDGAIKLFMEQGELLEQLENCRVAQARCLQQGEREEAEKHRDVQLKREEQILAIEDALKHQGDLLDEDREVCGAFLMFRREAHKELVLEAYRASRSFMFRLFQSQQYRFLGNRITVVQACEPTDLIWENLDFNKYKRKCVRWTTRVVAACTIFCGLLLLVYFKSVEVSVDTSIQPQDLWYMRAPNSTDSDCLRLCDWELSESITCDGDQGVQPDAVYSARGLEWSGAAADGAPNASQPAPLAGGGCWESPGCGAGGGGGDGTGWIAVRLPQPLSVRCMRLRTWQKQRPQPQPQPAGVGAATSAEQGPVLELFSCRADSFEGSAGSQWDPREHCVQHLDMYPDEEEKRLGVVTDADCTKGVTYAAAEAALLAGEDAVHSARVRCFCEQRLMEVGSAFKVPPYDTPEKQLCAEWSKMELQKVAFLLLAVLVVVVLNQVLLQVFTNLDRLARYETATELAKTQMTNLFWTQLANTGGCVLLVSMNLRTTMSNLSLEWTQLGQGPYDDFTSTWFVLAGTSLLITIAGQACSAILVPILEAKLLLPLQVKFFSRGVVTQTILNDLYILPEWKLSVRLAQTVTIMFCVIIYAGGMPLLYLIGAAYCLAAYWADKWCLLRACRQPPAYNGSTVTLALALFPIAGILHALVTLIIFGNQDIFPSAWGPLVGIMEWFMDFPLSSYDDVLEIYSSAGSSVRDEYFSDYVKARGLDFTRLGCSLLFLMFLVLVVFLIIALTFQIFRPFFKSVQLLLEKKFMRRLRGHWLVMMFQGKVTEDTFHQAQAKAVESNLVFSYKLSENPRYKEAHAALSTRSAALVASSAGLTGRTPGSGAAAAAAAAAAAPPGAGKVLPGFPSAEKALQQAGEGEHLGSGTPLGGEEPPPQRRRPSAPRASDEADTLTFTIETV